MCIRDSTDTLVTPRESEDDATDTYSARSSPESQHPAGSPADGEFDAEPLGQCGSLGSQPPIEVEEEPVQFPSQNDYGGIIANALLQASMGDISTANGVEDASVSNLHLSFATTTHSLAQAILESSDEASVTAPCLNPMPGSEEDILVCKVKSTDDEGAIETTTCTIYFPTLFQSLREQIGSGGVEQEAGFIESLLHNSGAALTGGKAGEFFMTDDNRFIIKMIQRDEKRQFCSMCVEYFDYCQDHAETKTALVQTLGLYRVKRSGSVLSQYLIVLPNLFCSMRAAGLEPKVYDIKGCTYGRRQANDTSTGFEVNLMELTNGSPLALSWNAKVNMVNAVVEDTHFLKQMQVVDYSLLVGVELETSTLIIGIVDYCRQYGLKEAAYSLYSKGRTIVEPEAYRNRFCEAMNRYFMYVPAHFEQEEQGSADGEESSDSIARSKEVLEGATLESVSYTHLTLPTKRIV
eukprot:TRINITY_DN20624_c0_g1_i1.p1 TRINITY_DN20624_c0_g1~~TRINITY_DN20624_c0_g1_i1.p1  ORF type:complete len:464 (-),score=118.46 TRINITY_DN20624_c0_g1_i1:113-1504(-)